MWLTHSAVRMTATQNRAGELKSTLKYSWSDEFSHLKGRSKSMCHQIINGLTVGDCSHEIKRSSIAPNPVESREGPPNSRVSLTSQKHTEKLPEATGTSRGNPGFTAVTQETP